MIVDVVKLVGGTLGGLAGGYVVQEIVGSLRPANVGKVGKVLWAFGGMCLGGAAGGAAGEYFEQVVDSAKEVIDGIKGVKA